MAKKKCMAFIFGLMLFVSISATTLLSKDKQNGANMKSIYEFVVKDIDGKIVARFGSRAKPESEEVIQAIQKVLASKE